VLASVGGSLVTLFIELGVLSVVMVFFGNLVVLQLPGVLVAAALLSAFVAGLGLMLSAGNVFFRDLNHLWGIVLQVWFFLTPVVYPAQIVEGKVPDWAFWVYEHLPMAVAVTLFRTLLYDGRYPSIQQYGYLALWGALALWVGWAVFNRLSPRFPEEI
jgi:ABC-type polysaccharide/polyol phosphate export permease